MYQELANNRRCTQGGGEFLAGYVANGSENSSVELSKVMATICSELFE